jgi:D-alanyl-D-alanine carboxypeptidase/D-alanyl-D-alanine-endopeptidase (penicillin-binding protein 4)
MEPIMLEGARRDVSNDDSPRTPTPALDTGRALAQQLGLDPTKVRLGQAPPGAAVAAKVQSAPLRDWLRQALVRSDNLLAETIGRRVAVADGQPASFTGAWTAVFDVLRRNGFDVSGVTLHDTSGLSTDDRATAGVLGAVIASAAGSNDKLRPLLDDLPIAGATGTLSDRYTTGPTRPGAGWVRAKTGTLTSVNTLAGYVVDADKRVLTFALMSGGSPADASRPALDAVTTALREMP